MLKTRIDQIIRRLEERTSHWKSPTVSQVAEETKDPFQILISTVLSARTKDETTEAASTRLFALADNPQKILRLTRRTIEKAIYPVGFYRTKAKHLLELCRQIMNRFHGKVPDTLEELMELKGVGRKTANLVITLGFNKLGICVDTHVHRISNRLGIVKTKTPEQTEMSLQRRLPRRYWIRYNDLLVSFGQNICKPISPLCTRCPIEKLCPKIGVKKHR